MVEVTRDVIIDLLPAYFSGEASEDTRIMVEKYFEQNPEFARMAHGMNEKLLQAVPLQLPQDLEMQTLRRKQRSVIWRVIVLALILAFFATTLLIALAFLVAR